jgi:hypothetical protein
VCIESTYDSTFIGLIIIIFLPAQAAIFFYTSLNVPVYAAAATVSFTFIKVCEALRDRVSLSTASPFESEEGK